MHTAKQLGGKGIFRWPVKNDCNLSLFNSSKRSKCNNNRNFHLCHKSAKNKQRFSQLRENSTHIGRKMPSSILLKSYIIAQPNNTSNNSSPQHDFNCATEFSLCVHIHLPSCKISRLVGFCPGSTTFLNWLADYFWRDRNGHREPIMGVS